MRQLAIYKYANLPDEESEHSGKVSRVHFMPDSKTDGEIKRAIKDYNSSQERYVASAEYVPDELVDAIEWLIKDRCLDVSRHLDVLEDIKSQISDIDDYLYSTIRDIKEELEKQNKKQ